MIKQVLYYIARKLHKVAYRVFCVAQNMDRNGNSYDIKSINSSMLTGVLDGTKIQPVRSFIIDATKISSIDFSATQFSGVLNTEKITNGIVVERYPYRTSKNTDVN